MHEQLCFALYVSSKELIRRYKPFLDQYKLTYTGYLVMVVLWHKDNLSLKEIGAELTLDSGTLTPLIKKLEKQNYIVKEKDKKDERNIRILLTEKGKKLEKKVKQIPELVFEANQIDTNKTDSLTDGLKKFSYYLSTQEN